MSETKPLPLDLGGWLSDPALRSCSVPARGLWIEIRFWASESDNYSRLGLDSALISPSILARLTGAHSTDIEAWLEELRCAGLLEDTDRSEREPLKEAYGDVEWVSELTEKVR